MADRLAPAWTRRISETTFISRDTTVLAAPVKEEILIMTAESGRYLGLDSIGSDIWRRLEQPCQFGALIDALTAHYEADWAVIADDVAKLLLEMESHRLVNLD